MIKYLVLLIVTTIFFIGCAQINKNSSHLHKRTLAAQTPGGPYVPTEILKSLEGFFTDINETRELYNTNKDLSTNIARVINYEVGNGEFYFKNTENYSKEILVRALIRVIVVHGIAAQDLDPRITSQKWPSYMQDWNDFVKPFLETNQREISTLASYSFRASLAMRYLILLTSEKEAIEQINLFINGPKLIEITNKLTPLFRTGRSFSDTNKAIKQSRYGKEPIFLIFSLKFPAPVFDSPEECRHPAINSKNHKDQAILKQQKLMQTIFVTRPVREQIGGTCYANLASEMLDIHRDVKLYKDFDASPWSHVPTDTIYDKVHEGQKLKERVFNLKQKISDLTSLNGDKMSSYKGLTLDDHFATYLTRQGRTSAYYAAAVYTAEEESSLTNISDFDGGYTVKTINSLLKHGGCPQSEWEFQPGEQRKSTEFYKVFDLVNFIHDPENYSGNTSEEELLSDLKVYSGIFNTLKSFNNKSNPLFDNFVQNPKKILAELNINPKLLQKLLVYSAGAMSCGNAHYRRGDPLDKIKEFKLESLENYELPIGRKINYPKGYAVKIFDRHYKDSDNFNDLKKIFKQSINDPNFQGIGISANNHGLLEGLSFQDIIDLDRIISGDLMMYHGYNPKFEYNRYGSYLNDSYTGHTFMMMDMRYNYNLGQCEYKLRNSWGDYQNYKDYLVESKWIDLTTDNKYDLWVASHHLYRNLHSSSIIKPNYKNLNAQ